MTKPNRPTVRLLVSEPLEKGAVLNLGAEATHYLRNVLRRDVGAEIGLFNNGGDEFRAELTKVGKKAVEVQLHDVVARYQPLRPVTLYMSVIKRTPFELVLAKATELGATAIQPLLTDHTQSEKLRIDRLEAIMQEAAEQSERLDVPELRKPMSLEALLRSLDSPLVAAVEAGESQTPSEVLSAVMPEGLIIGPEGGFSPQELEALRTHPKVTGIGLGPRILKAETAALSLLTLLQAHCGDWDERPDFRGTAAV